MELGNLVFGNSRGNFSVNRDLVNSDEWKYLVHILLQVEDYHCIMGEYFEDYTTSNLDVKERTNNLTPNKYGGYTCIYNGKKIFEIFPYWWGDCTCGVDDKNKKIEKNLRKAYFSKKELKVLDYTDEYCEDDCPASIFKEENTNKTRKELAKICTCKVAKKNLKYAEEKKLLRKRERKLEKELDKKLLYHEETCRIIKHNFVFYNEEEKEEFCIDWYKYPFRDSYMNINLSDDEIKGIFSKCAEILKEVIKENKGTWKE